MAIRRNRSREPQREEMLHQGGALLAWEIERPHWERGLTELVGIDEAGRGPLAGPVIAAAVTFDADVCRNFPSELAGLNDSKKLKHSERERLFPLITAHAAAYGIGAVSAAEIDELNILQGTMKAMTLAVHSLEAMLAKKDRTPELLLVDGNYFRTSLGHEFQTVVHGDARSPLIAAASVLAKVTRDRIMMELDTLYPQYGFASNKGYGTKAHQLALDNYGPCPEHRRSFRPERFEQLGLAFQLQDREMPDADALP